MGVIRRTGVPPPATLRRGRLTRLGSKVMSAGAVLTLLSFAGSAPALTLVGLALLIAPLLALLTPTGLGSLVVEAAGGGGETTVGEDATLTLQLRSGTGRAIRRFGIQWGGGGWESGSEVVARVPAGTRVLAPVRLTAARHAVVASLVLDVADTGALGMAVRRAEVRVRLPAEQLIVPRVLTVPAPELPPAVWGSDDNGSPLALAVSRGDFPRGSRPFRAGDEQRSVSWRATARSGRLTVREWDPPQAPAPLALAVLLPPPQLPPPQTDSLVAEASDLAAERLLSAMASLAAAAARQGRELSLTHAAIVTAEGITSRSNLGTGLLGAAALVRAMAAVPSVWVAPMSELAARAATLAGPGGSVLLGVNLAGASWLPEAFLSCMDVVTRAGCTLEVVVSHPRVSKRAWDAGDTAAALGQLAARCTVLDADLVLTQQMSAPPTPAR